MKSLAHGTALNNHLTEVEIRRTGKRYCTNCKLFQPAEGGLKVRHRWMCPSCAARRAAHLATLRQQQQLRGS